MTIRLDKCQSFGAMKLINVFSQIEPAIHLNNNKIPPVAIGSSFTYLGKIFDLDGKNQEAKKQIIQKLSNLLNITSNLKITAQTKLKIYQQYIFSQLTFELKLYKLGTTWVNNNIDFESIRHIRNWLSLPPSACVQELITTSNIKIKMRFRNPFFPTNIRKTSSKEQILSKKQRTTRNATNLDRHQEYSRGLRCSDWEKRIHWERYNTTASKTQWSLIATLPQSRVPRIIR